MVAIGVFLLALVTARPHATLLLSEPAANAVLRASPTRVRLVFSEPIEASLSQVHVVGLDGRAHALAPTGDPHDVHAVLANLDQLEAGEYRVEWRVVSADGHPVSGSYRFDVGARAPATTAMLTSADTIGRTGRDTIDVGPTASASVSYGPSILGAPLLAAVARGLALGSLMALAGLLALGEGTLPNAGGGVGRATFVLAVASVVLLTLHAMLWQLNAAGGAGWSALLDSGTGHRELARTGLALLALWALGLARRRGIAAVLALAALVVSGDVGHPAAIHPLWAVPAKTLHLLAGALWLGGLLWIVLSDPSHPRYRDGVARISGVALIAVILVAASGVVQALLFLPSVGAMLHSSYGALSIAKLVGLMVLVAFGAHHRRRLLPRLAVTGAAAPLVSSVRAELAVMAVVILIGGLLAYVPPT